MYQNIFSERIGMALLPTPLKKMEKISEEMDSNIFIKRDDLTNFLSSGNKIRKLEFLFEDALKSGADTVVTCGGIQSNHCRATAVMAREIGLKPVLFLRGEDTEKPQGNLLIDKLLDCEIHWITSEQYKIRDEIMKEYRNSCENNEKVYIIPEGGSNEIGALGYAKAMAEIDSQIDINGMQAVFSAVGSGGTMAGLIIGKKLVKSNMRIIGINVTKDSAEDFKERIYDIIRSSISRYGFGISVEKNEIEIYDDFVGEGYAIPTQDGINNIVSVMRKEGVMLDPVYTSKAFTGMKYILKDNNFKNVIFLHTGGSFANFAYSEFFNEFF